MIVHLNKGVSLKNGFTLLEIMVVIAIVTFISGVAMFSYSTFSDNLALSSAAQQVALEIRQAQSYGLSVKQDKASSQFVYPYGISVSLDDPTNYYIFVDENNNYEYDSIIQDPDSVELVQQMALQNNIKITAICGAAFGGGTLTCPPNQTVHSMTVLFLRPDPDAAIRFVNADGSLYSGGGTFQVGEITLTSPHGKTANVVIQNTGEISVQ